MGLFNRRKQRAMNSVIQHDGKVEIVAHKHATKEQVEEVNRANESLQKVLEKNHFTIKIFVAAGGQSPAHKTRTKRK